MLGEFFFCLDLLKLPFFASDLLRHPLILPHNLPHEQLNNARLSLMP